MACRAADGSLLVARVAKQALCRGRRGLYKQLGARRLEKQRREVQFSFAQVGNASVLDRTPPVERGVVFADRPCRRALPCACEQTLSWNCTALSHCSRRSGCRAARPRLAEQVDVVVLFLMCRKPVELALVGVRHRLVQVAHALVHGVAQLGRHLTLVFVADEPFPCLHQRLIVARGADDG